MSNLEEKINEDFKNSLKEKDEQKLTLLRMVKSALKNEEIQKKEKLSDEEIETVIKREIKKRKEAIELYQKGQREDLIQKEKAEIEILTNYLPEQMSEEEIKDKVEKIIQEMGAEGKEDFGKVMGKVMTELKGRADGSLVSKIVNELLNQ